VTTPQPPDEPEVEVEPLWANGKTDLEFIEALAEVDLDFGKEAARVLLEVED
jgi:hypothetical protein